MKIIFENENEKEALKHILTEWFIHNDDYDVLGCEPACRNESSPGCDWCIEDYFNYYLNQNKLDFNGVGGEEWILKHSISSKNEK